MSVTGQQRIQENKRYVGFTQVKVVAVNPSRSELNELLGKEDSDEDKQINYSFTDKEGNQGVRVSLWLHDQNKNKYFVHNILITDRESISKAGDKVQVINSTCDTSWVPFKKDEEGKQTDEPDLSLAQDWFLNFTDRKTKEILAPKSIRIALSGEDELCVFLKTWLGRMNFSRVGTEVEVDPQALVKEDFTELRNLITLTDDAKAPLGYDSELVILLGVETDEKDSTKKYQKVFSKAFLPAGFMRFIKPGEVKAGNDYEKNTWKRFEKNLEGDYGFKAYYEICPLSEYDERNDIAGSSETKVKKEAPEPASSKY